MSEVKPPGRLNSAVAGAAKRLSRRTTLLGLVVLAVGAFLGYIAWTSINGVPFQDRYKLNAVISRDSPIVKKGDAVRIAGRLAGFIVDVVPHEGNVKLTMELRPAFAPVGEDAHANVRVRSLVYLTYLEILPGDISEPLEEGDTIPLENTGSGTDLLEVVQLFDEEARNALRRATYNAGIGLAGRGTELNAALADIRATFRDGVSELEAVTSTPGAIEGIVSGAARTFRGALGERSDDVAGLITSGAAVVGTVAGRDTELARTIELLAPVEEEFLATAPFADPLLDESAALARELDPALAQLADALPAVNGVLMLGDVLRNQTARLTAAIDPVLAAAAPILAALQPTVASLGPLVRPLNVLTSTLGPYARDIRRTGLGFQRGTQKNYPEGATAGGNPALRFSPVLTCHNNRDPYPEPGEPLGHSQAC